MVKMPGLIVASAVAALAVWFVASGQPIDLIRPSEFRPSGSNTGELRAETVTEPETEASPPADALPMTVSHVHDGDTLFLIPADGPRQKVRLIGIDTPELQPAEDCYAIAARDYLRRLVPDGSVVTVSADVEPLDRYGRSLYYLWTADGEFVNLKLVEGGYGTALRIEPNIAHWNELVAAEDSARSAAAGLWGEC